MNGISAITSINSLMAQRAIGQHSRAITQIMERLATGKRINHAKDDPAGLIAATNLDLEANEIRAEIDANEATSYRLGALDGAYGVLADLALDLESVVLTAANRAGRSDAELEGLQIEADSIIRAMDHIYKTATFKGERLFDKDILVRNAGSYTSVGVTPFNQLGQVWAQLRTSESEGTPPDPDQSGDPGAARPASTPKAPTSQVSLIDLLTGGRLNLIDGDIEAAQKVAQATREGLVKARASVGSQIQGLERRREQLFLRFEANRGVYASIMDTDFAAETSNLVRAQVLQQASIFVLQQSQQTHERTLALLFGR
ncbi:MAG: flagellin [Phycisphaerales bacterium]|nr:flagellin [Phycisphaerales bacterium]